MKPHHLDEIIKELKHLHSKEEVIEFDLVEHLITIYEEIKRIDETYEALSDWVHDYED